MSSDPDHAAPQGASQATVSAWNARRFLAYVKKPAIGVLVVTLLDLIGMLLVLGTIPKTTLVLVLFLEGSIGLIGGTGIVFSSTPSISKIGEMTIGTARWSMEAERHAEKVGGKWIIGSSILILIGFVLSMI